MSIVNWNWQGLLQGSYLAQIASDMAAYICEETFVWQKKGSYYWLQTKARCYLLDLDPFIATIVPREASQEIHEAFSDSPVNFIGNFPGPRKGKIEAIYTQEDSSLVLITQSHPCYQGYLIRLGARVPNIVWIDENVHPLNESRFEFSLKHLDSVSASPLSSDQLTQIDLNWQKRRQELENARQIEQIHKYFDKEISALDNRLEKLNKSLERAPKPDELKEEALLYQAYGWDFEKSETLQVWDWKNEREVCLKKPQIPLQDYIHSLFHKAKGYEKHLIILKSQIESLQSKKIGLLKQLESCLTSLTLPKPKTDPKSKVESNPLLKGVRQFEYLGALFLVGKSSEDNMKLSFKIACGNDLWLHVQDFPGSHVVVKKLKPETLLTSPQILEIGALLAHHFSSARQQSEVDVTWTLAKWVKKIPGAKSGTVGLQEAHRLPSRQNPALLAHVLALSQSLCQGL